MIILKANLIKISDNKIISVINFLSSKFYNSFKDVKILTPDNYQNIVEVFKVIIKKRF